MEVLKKIGSFILNFLIIVVSLCFIVALYHYISIKIMGNPYTNFLGYTYFNIKTGSMEDTINIDDYVFVKITDDVQVDDIISFVDKDKVVTHRIIEIKEDNKIVTKGDANNTPDDEILREQVIGKVVKVGKGYGVFLKVFTDPVVVIPFIAALIFINLAFTGTKKRLAQ
ncbi:MAG TPA: signal peptidase I [Firmicutes bacterium]|nr:signal peptidase I [Bacillota bacterium]